MLQYVWNDILCGNFKNFNVWNFRSKDSSGVEFEVHHIHETDKKWSLTMVIENGNAENDTLTPIRVSQHFVQKQWIIKYTSDYWKKRMNFRNLFLNNIFRIRGEFQAKPHAFSHICYLSDVNIPTYINKSTRALVVVTQTYINVRKHIIMNLLQVFKTVFSHVTSTHSIGK
jgi:hypothetical protein